jgi:hypothetical protein
VLVLVEVIVIVPVEVFVDVIVGPVVIRQEHAEEITEDAVMVADAPMPPLYLYTVAVVPRLLNGLLVKVETGRYEVEVGAVIVTVRVAVLQTVSTQRLQSGVPIAYAVAVTTTSTVEGTKVVVTTALVEIVEVAVAIVVVVFFRNEEQKGLITGTLRKALACGHEGALVMQVACFVTVAALASRTAADARGRRRSEKKCIS